MRIAQATDRVGGRPPLAGGSPTRPRATAVVSALRRLPKARADEAEALAELVEAVSAAAQSACSCGLANRESSEDGSNVRSGCARALSVRRTEPMQFLVRQRGPRTSASGAVLPISLRAGREPSPAEAHGAICLRGAP